MSLRGAGNLGRQRQHGERGATAVEAAIVTPLVMALLFGIIELGFLFKDYLAAAGAVRAGVRMASANPRTASFAQDAVNDVARTGGAMNLADVKELWVYKVDKANAAKNLPVGLSDFSGLCNVCVRYRWDVGTKLFVSTYDNWPAASQNACSSSSTGGPPDRIGVYIRLKHDAFTGLVFNTITISEASIMSLEPMSSLAGCK